jgi:hypothetical protein
MTKKYLLYFDDTGGRDPDKSSYQRHEERRDGMDCFGYGGFLIKEEDVKEFIKNHNAFRQHWNIDYPLHSSKIRGGHGKFGWLKKPENAGQFLPALQDYLLSQPIICIACIIDRPGYVERYKERHQEKLWYMSQSAFYILIERAAKFADKNGRKLEIYFEQNGRKEDRDITRYMRELKKSGNPFNKNSSDQYNPLTTDDYKRIILGEPRRKTKNVPMIQIADLVLYPMAKAGYDPQYWPYKALRDNGKLIDCLLSEEELASCGIKYSCFDRKKSK